VTAFSIADALLPTMVRGVSDPDGESPRQPQRLHELEPAHLAAFTAFRRAQNEADKGLVDDDLAANHLAPELNPALARRVYNGSEGSIYLLPGPCRICCVAISMSGESMVSDALTVLVGRDPMGYITGGPGPEVTFVGALPAGCRDLRILQRSGRSVSAPLSEDQSYWVTVNAPTAMLWTQADGTTQRRSVADPGGFRAYRR